jgi:outer membrane receptor protein involved in Fe transport
LVRYTLDGSGPNSHPSFPIESYTDADFAFGYKLELPRFNDRSLSIRLNVLNVFNNHSLTGLFSTASSGAALYATNPGRAVFLSVSAAI